MTDDLKARLREPVLCETTMQGWDSLRRSLEAGRHKGSSHPRDWLEALLSCVDEDHREAADAIERLERERDEARAAMDRQRAAVRTFENAIRAEHQHLRDKDRSEYVAAQTVNSERDANAILTDEIALRDALLARALEALDAVATEYPWHEDIAKARDVAAAIREAIGE